MKIKLGFDKKSIEKAKEQVDKMITDLKNNNVITDLLNGCADWFIAEANKNLAQTDIGASVKFGIMGSWDRKQNGNSMIIINTNDKAVFVEFGVGAVGGENENRHPNANELGNDYEYNVPSIYKYAGKYHDENTWRFYVRDESQIDLIDGNYETWDTKDGKVKVITQGSPSVMYAYNALVDLHDRGVYEVWKEIKKKYWG